MREAWEAISETHRADDAHIVSMLRAAIKANA